MTEFITTFTLNFFAELGDKTQFTAMMLSSRFGARPVTIGILLAVMLLQGIAVAFGGLSSSLIKNEAIINLIAGIVFLAFGIVSFRKEEEEEENSIESKKINSIVFSVFALFFVAELGDKTQIATLVKASTSNNLILTYLGAVIGFFLSNMIGILAGKFLSEKIDSTKISIISGVIFTLFGLYYISRFFIR